VRSLLGWLATGGWGVCVAGEIPPPAGEDAVVRDDAEGEGVERSAVSRFGNDSFTSGETGEHGGTAGRAADGAVARGLGRMSASGATESLGPWWGIVPILNDEIPQ